MSRCYNSYFYNMKFIEKDDSEKPVHYDAVTEAFAESVDKDSIVIDDFLSDVEYVE